MPVARRVLGEGHNLTLKMRWIYAMSLYRDDGATLDDLREAMTTLEDAEQTARRVLGGVHPTTMGIERQLQNAQAALCVRENADLYRENADLYRSIFGKDPSEDSS